MQSSRPDRILITLALLALLIPILDPQGSPGLINSSVYASNGQPLTIVASATPTAGKAPLDVTFSGSASGGTPDYALFWDFGDGSTALGSIVTHLYRFPGNFTAEFWVQDSSNPPAKISQAITIKVHGVGALTVRVLDQNRTAVTSATVRMLAGPDGQELLAGETGLDGYVSFGDVAEGIYSLETAAVGFKNSNDTVAVVRGNPAFTEIVLVPEERSSGTPPASLLPILAAGGVGAATLALLIHRRRKGTAPSHVVSTTKPRKSKGTSPPKRLRSMRLLSSP